MALPGLIKEFLSSSEEETQNIAKELSEKFIPGDFIALIGNLGSGKTFFVKKFCESIGIQIASSPSFAIVNEYSLNKRIYHFDFYRVKNATELIDLGFYEYLKDDDAILFAEWADMFPEVLPHKRYELKFQFIDDLQRKISLLKYE